MPSLAGLISGVLGGAAQAYGEGAQMEMKKQSELDLRKQLLEAESDKRLREDEIKRGRDIVDEDRKLSSEYIAKVSAADLEKSKGAIANRTTMAPLAVPADVAEGKAAAKTKEDLAPINAAAEVVVGKAKAEVQVALAPEQAKAARAQFDAEKDLRGLRVDEATADQIKKAKTLVADKDYMDALIKTDLAAHQHLIDIANINRAGAKEVAQIRGAFFDARTDEMAEAAQKRLEQARLNSANKGAGGGSTVPATADLQRQITAAENSLANKLGVKRTDLNEALASLQKRTDPVSKAKFDGLATERATLDSARKRLLEWSKTPAAAAPAAAAPAAAASSGPVAAPGARPALSTFGSK